MIGKVFWAGAVAAMGEPRPARGRAGAARAGAQGARRPAPHSSMEGEAEYGFWHVLVRDVAYGQIPRAARRPDTRPPPRGWKPRPANGSKTWPTSSPITTCAARATRAAGDDPGARFRGVARCAPDGRACGRPRRSARPSEGGELLPPGDRALRPGRPCAGPVAGEGGRGDRRTLCPQAEVGRPAVGWLYSGDRRRARRGRGASRPEPTTRRTGARGGGAGRRARRGNCLNGIRRVESSHVYLAARRATT